jgi:hypothetical protein
MRGGGSAEGEVGAQGAMFCSRLRSCRMKQRHCNPDQPHVDHSSVVRRSHEQPLRWRCDQMGELAWRKWGQFLKEMDTNLIDHITKS